MSNILVLSGYACTSEIWNELSDVDYSNLFNKAIFLDFPKEKLKGFKDIENFSQWIEEVVDYSKIDYVIGHSMGGLVALDLAYRNVFKIKQVIAIESFIKTPSPFFQNLVMDEHELEKKQLIEMFSREAPHYSLELAEKLKVLDWVEKVSKINAQKAFIYGDRNQGREKTISELGICDKLENKTTIKIVERACHFPMIENPNGLYNELACIIRGQ